MVKHLHTSYFLSLATLKGIGHILQEDQPNVPKDSNILDDTDDNDKKKLWESN
jgi:hypothetical protein